MLHHPTAQVSAPIGQAPVEQASPPASFDFYTAYCASTTKVYGAKYCMTREQWDAACKAPRKTRRLTETEFDTSQFSEEYGDGPIY